tara:strand:- start:2643 stop:2792 length:150 start_codon:yes stop_codon:yes gene_type:complete
MTDLPEWRKKALADPELSEWQVQVLLNGPQSLSQAWFLGAMRFKYGRDS